MNYYLGIDLGTSGIKGVLYDKYGKIIDSTLIEYNIISIKEGYAEEDPLIWKDSLIKLLQYFGNKKYIIKGLSLSGQMHGLVILDKDDNVLRNSIIWCQELCSCDKYRG